MCSPAYAPNGAFVAYTGISLNNFDGRADIYTANPNGFGSVNLTGDMRGTMTFLRWISTPDDTE
jgi:Tol biopolymer transport system component